MAEKISGVYKITNIVTNDFYIGSSTDVKHRWSQHKCPSSWKIHPNSPLYQDFQKYGVDSFEFQVIAEVKPECLKEAEQQFIEKLKPIYNNANAKGLDIERQKEYQKSEKYKSSHRKARNKYNNQLCLYNDEKLTLHALSSRFRRAGIENPAIEAKKYLIK